MSTAFVPLLVPIVTSVVAALGLMLKEARRARDRRNLREQALAEASAEVAFARDWWQAHQLLGVTETHLRDTALDMLVKAEAKVSDTQHLSSREKGRVTLRRLLLMWPMQRRPARIVRVLFWVNSSLLAISAMTVGGEAFDSTGPNSTGGTIITLTFFGFVSLGLRAWAVSADRQHAVEPSDLDRVAPAQPGGETSVRMPGASIETSTRSA